MEPIDNSDSLFYDAIKAKKEQRRQNMGEDAGGLDNVLKNIREILINGNKKLKTVSPDLIDQIYRFENLNDFSKMPDLDELFDEQEEIDKLKQQRKKKKRGRTQKPSNYSQFGYETNGLANLMMQTKAIESKATLKNTLEINFREMVKKYDQFDVKEMIANQEHAMFGKDQKNPKGGNKNDKEQKEA